VDGIVFDYSFGLSTLDVASGGPGNTNNVDGEMILSAFQSFNANAGVLSLDLPTFVYQFGYGFALAIVDPRPSATTISIFSGETLLGALTYAGAPDPIFTGGFAGIQNDVSFNRVRITFDSLQTQAFAMDNIRLAPVPVPEPTSLLLFGTGAVALLANARRRKKHQTQ
jgi:hypothetical protein